MSRIRDTQVTLVHLSGSGEHSDVQRNQRFHTYRTEAPIQGDFDHIQLQVSELTMATRMRPSDWHLYTLRLPAL